MLVISISWVSVGWVGVSIDLFSNSRFVRVIATQTLFLQGRPWWRLLSQAMRMASIRTSMNVDSQFDCKIMYPISSFILVFVAGLQLVSRSKCSDYFQCAKLLLSLW